jgi:hypothetical protein
MVYHGTEDDIAVVDIALAEEASFEVVVDFHTDLDARSFEYMLYSNLRKAIDVCSSDSIAEERWIDILLPMDLQMMSSEIELCFPVNLLYEWLT